MMRDQGEARVHCDGGDAGIDEEFGGGQWPVRRAAEEIEKARHLAPNLMGVCFSCETWRRDQIRT
jgi:hypothetical protein